MIKYTFFYRLDLKGRTNILNYETVRINLKDAVEDWEKFKLTQNRVIDLIIFIRISRQKVLH